MTTYREEKKYSSCSYKSVANSNLYLPGPACLQPTFERTQYDIDMMKMYNPNSSSTIVIDKPVMPSSTVVPENYSYGRKCKCGQK